mmetsp:Transcript_117347/g.373887  ORF Transcript_117347/g.373887 Transcript_117347/m.373887 type:complete len:664 (-) Transcript_117347:920-2911(-)
MWLPHSCGKARGDAESNRASWQHRWRGRLHVGLRWRYDHRLRLRRSSRGPVRKRARRRGRLLEDRVDLPLHASAENADARLQLRLHQRLLRLRVRHHRGAGLGGRRRLPKEASHLHLRLHQGLRLGLGIRAGQHREAPQHRGHAGGGSGRRRGHHHGRRLPGRHDRRPGRQRRRKGARCERVGRLGAREDLNRGWPALAEQPPLVHQRGLVLVAHKAVSVAELGVQHHRPDAGAQRGQAREVACSALRLQHVLVLVGGDELRQAYGREQRGADPRAVRVAGQADDRHAHQERLARGRRVGVREGVQRDVHLIVDLQMIKRRRGQRQQLQPVLRNALRLEAVDEGLLHIGGVEALVLHEQPAVRHLSHDPCPERDARLGDLGEATETAESHVAVLQCRECVYVRDAHRGGVAEEDAGHPDELLAVGLLGLDGVHDAVGDAVVDGAEPRRVVVANVGALYRCRLQRADVQAVVGSVPSELHQDVDSIRTDDLGDLLRRFPRDLLPVRVRHETLEKLRLLVFPSGGGVKENLEKVPVVVLEEGVTEEGHRVVEVVGRNVADAQFPVHRARHGPLGVRGAQLPAEALRPGAVRLEDPIWIDLVQVVQRQEPVLSRVLRGRRQLDASLVHSQGLVQVAVIPEQPAQVVVGLRIGRRDGHGAREVLQRL